MTRRPASEARLQPERVVLRLSRNIQRAASEPCSRPDGAVLRGAPLSAR